MGVQRNVYKDASPKGPPIWINFFPEGGERLLLPPPPPCWHQCPPQASDHAKFYKWHPKIICMLPNPPEHAAL